MSSSKNLTVEQFAQQHGLWSSIQLAINDLATVDSARIVTQIANLPVRPSRAVRSLGCYASRQGEPVCIRLQFAQEPSSLRDTFLHELAHLCDHLCHQHGQRYRRAHGSHWQRWATAFGATAERCGKSEALDQLHLQRLKLVAVCRQCGAEFHRLRRLNRRRKYQHSNCGGQLRLV